MSVGEGRGGEGRLGRSGSREERNRSLEMSGALRRGEGTSGEVGGALGNLPRYRRNTRGRVTDRVWVPSRYLRSELTVLSRHGR